jgi:mRNA-degrading endonuclease toxin of MazEF toxin-antitoxin module
MAGRVIQRGEIWMLDLGYGGKIRPALVVSIPFLDNERTLLTYVPRTTRVWGTRFEVLHTARSFLPGAFDVQSISSAPSVSFLRKLATLDDATLALVEEKLKLSLELK